MPTLIVARRIESSFADLVRTALDRTVWDASPCRLPQMTDQQWLACMEWSHLALHPWATLWIIAARLSPHDPPLRIADRIARLASWGGADSQRLQMPHIDTNHAYGSGAWRSVGTVAWDVDPNGDSRLQLAPGSAHERVIAASFVRAVTNVPVERISGNSVAIAVPFSMRSAIVSIAVHACETHGCPPDAPNAARRLHRRRRP